MTDLDWELIATLMAIVVSILAVGKFIQKQNDLARRQDKIEKLLSWDAPEGPAFVHRSLFDMQNEHNDKVLEELKINFAGLEEKIDRTNELLATLVSRLD